MGRLIIEGKDNQLKIIAKTNKIRASKHGLKFIFEEEKPQSDKVIVPTAKELIKSIEGCETIEALNEFSSDERKSVKAAYDKKLEELKKPE